MNSGVDAYRGSASGSEVAALRLRASKCRDFARKYAADVGSSLSDLAVELDREADRIAVASAKDRKSDRASPPGAGS